MNGKKPNKKERAWISLILEYGCAVCRNEMGLYSPCEVHHISGGSNHLDTIGLCFHHHRSGINNSECVSRHPYMAAWEDRYGTEQELLDKLRLEIGDV